MDVIRNRIGRFTVQVEHGTTAKKIKGRGGRRRGRGWSRRESERGGRVEGGAEERKVSEACCPWADLETCMGGAWV